MAGRRNCRAVAVVGVMWVVGLVIPNSADARLGPPKPPPYSASRYAVPSFVAPDLTRELSSAFTATPNEVVLRVWGADGQPRERYRGPENDCRALGVDGILLVRDRQQRAWRLESYLTGKALAIPFGVASEDNPWVSVTRDLQTVAVENWIDRERASLTFYIGGKQATRYDLRGVSWGPHSQMSEDGYLADLSGPREISSAEPAELILFDPRGGIRWRTALAGGEGRWGAGGLWPAAGGRGVLCADYVPDGGDGGSRSFEFFDADGKPRPALRFEEATEFRAWVGDTTVALFESKREVETPGHTLTLADCAQGRIMWQIPQPDVDRSALIAVEDPTGKPDSRIIVQAVHRTWEGGKRTGFYAPYGLVELRFLRAGDGRVIDSFETVSGYVDNAPARFYRRGGELWLVESNGARKVDLARATSRATSESFR